MCLLNRAGSLLRATALLALYAATPLSFILIHNSAQAERQLTGATTLSSKDRVSIILNILKPKNKHWDSEWP